MSPSVYPWKETENCSLLKPTMVTTNGQKNKPKLVYEILVPDFQTTISGGACLTYDFRIYAHHRVVCTDDIIQNILYEL